MKEKLAKLIDLKSITTLAFVGAIITLAFMGKVDSKEIVGLATMIIVFYFGKQSSDKS
jgi:hypothetical protein